MNGVAGDRGGILVAVIELKKRSNLLKIDDFSVGTDKQFCRDFNRAFEKGSKLFSTQNGACVKALS